VKLTDAIRRRSELQLQSVVARHVSAQGLQSLDLPTLSKHHHLPPTDQLIWNDAYREEYMGLHNIPNPISTITSILAQHQKKACQGHIDAAKHVVKYIKQTKSLGISFSSKGTSTIESFVKFPITTNQLCALTDANWGPQDQSAPKATSPPQEVELFKSRSISGFLIHFHGPLHWMSKRQTVTATSSGEAEIYATNSCVKEIIHLRHIIQDLNLDSTITIDKIPIYNDNAACVDWSKGTTTKAIRHFQIKENHVRENVQRRVVHISHVDGKRNLADLFTKEDKNTEHFILMRDALLTAPPIITSSARRLTVSHHGPLSSQLSPPWTRGVLYVRT